MGTPAVAFAGSMVIVRQSSVERGIGTILAGSKPVMKQWWLISAVGAASLLLTLLVAWPRTAPASPMSGREEAAGPAETPQPAVRVQQILVTAEAVASAPAPMTSTSRPSPLKLVGTSGSRSVADPPATPPARLSTPAAPRPMFERAKRAFLGDGRHQPQPFPRVKDN